MSDLDNYFDLDKVKHEKHPLIRLLEIQRGKPDFVAAKLEIIRPRAALGFEPARFSLQFINKQGDLYDYRIEPWDAELNEALIDRDVQAIDESNESQRFGLALSSAFQRPENRYGDGFFSAVLMLVLDLNPFADMLPVKELRPYISTRKPYQGGKSVEDCSEIIQSLLQDRWIELRRNLKYEKVDAERILGAAIAYYLDERFSITDGRKLGWLKAR